NHGEADETAYDYLHCPILLESIPRPKAVIAITKRQFDTPERLPQVGRCFSRRPSTIAFRRLPLPWRWSPADAACRSSFEGFIPGNNPTALMAFRPGRGIFGG